MTDDSVCKQSAREKAYTAIRARGHNIILSDSNCKCEKLSGTQIDNYVRHFFQPVAVHACVYVH